MAFLSITGEKKTFEIDLVFTLKCVECENYEMIQEILHYCDDRHSLMLLDLFSKNRLWASKTKLNWNKFINNYNRHQNQRLENIILGLDSLKL